MSFSPVLWPWILLVFALGIGLSIAIDRQHRKEFLKIFKDFWHGRQSNRTALDRVKRESLEHKNPIRKHNSDLATGIAALTFVDHWLGIAYKAWYSLPSKARFFLCLPACAALVILFFCTVSPVFLAIMSFDAAKPFMYIFNIIPIFAVHLSIYLLMARYRFLFSGLLAINLLLFSVVFFVELPPGSDLWTTTYRSILHCLAAVIIARTWIKSRLNRPAAMFRLAGGMVMIAGIFNTLLSVFMFSQTSSIADKQAAAQILSLPLYRFFEPLLRQIMTPLHLQVGNFLAENLILAILILAWGGLVFCVGCLMCIAKYDSIATIPDEVGSLKIYT